MTEQEISKNIEEDMTYCNKLLSRPRGNGKNYCEGMFRGLERTARYLGYGW